MKWFNNLKIGSKLLLSFILVALIAGAVGYTGISKIRTIADADMRLYEKNTLSLAAIGVIDGSFQRIRVDFRSLILNRGSKDRQKFVDEINTMSQTMYGHVEELSKSVNTDEERQQVIKLQATMDDFRPVTEKIINLAMSNQEDQALAYLSSQLPLAQAVDNSITGLTALEEIQAKKIADQNTATANTSQKIMLLMVIMAITLAIGLGVIISRTISIPIKTLVQAADKLALGNVDVQITSDSRDEIGDLIRSFAAMAENTRSQALVAERIAAGDMNVEIVVRSDKDLLNQKLGEMSGNIKALINETGRLTGAAKDGQLNTRGNSSAFSGGWGEIIAGLNEILDAVVKPIQESASVLNEMARGNLQVNVSGNYKGDHAVIKDALNDTINSISGYVAEISQVLGEISKGNLDVSIARDYRGDFLEIKEAINLIIQSLNDVLGEINQASEQVATGAMQVSDSSQTLSQASTEQASSVQEITATMTEIGNQTKQNAINANQANELAIAAKENAIQGNLEMQEMLKAMSEINDASINISKIIKVIDEIAFQTNILALNAAVEAARAGQHGKGFAVVAEEVRNLAARSANAAKETTVMIEGSVKKAEMGTRIANETAQALNKIVQGVSTAAALVGDIAIASNEQATAITQINQGIAGVAEVTQLNTATAQQSAAASEELASQADLLKNRANRFKIRNDSSLQNLQMANPGIIKMLKNLLENKPGEDNRSQTNHNVYKEMGVPISKVQIALDDKDFGKY